MLIGLVQAIHFVSKEKAEFQIDYTPFNHPI